MPTLTPIPASKLTQPGIRSFTKCALSSAAVAGIAAALLAPATLAQPTEAPAKEGQATELPAVKVEGEGETYQQPAPSSPKLTEPLRDTPQSIVIIPQAVMEDRGVTTLREALRNVPSVTMMAGEGGGAQGDNLKIRGFNANNDLYIDGIRDLAQYSRDPFAIEQIEVAMGPAGAYSGRGSAGGSINLVSKMPTVTPFVHGYGGVGTDEFYRGTLDWNVPLGIDGAAFRLNVMGHHNDVARRDYITAERWGVAPSLAFGLGTPTRVYLSYLHVESDGIADYGLPFITATTPGAAPGQIGKPAPVDLSNFYGFLDIATEETIGDVGTLRVEHDLSDAVFVRAQVRYAEGDRFAIVMPPRNPNLTLGTVQRNPSIRDTLNTLLIGQFDLTARFSTGTIEHALVVGVEFGRETIDQQAYTHTGPAIPLDDLFNPNPHAAVPGAFIRGTYTETEADSSAFYVTDTVKLTPQWELIGGVRWETFDVETVAVPVAGATTRFSRDDDFFSYRAAIVYKPIEEASLYATYSTSFNPIADAFAVTAATSPVEPQENEVFEIGGKWDVLEERLSLTAAAFWMTKQNVFILDPITLVSDYVGEQQVDGFEVGASGNLTDEWALFAGYTYLDSEIVRSATLAEFGKRLASVPEHAFNVWTSYRLTAWNVEIGGGVTYVGERPANNTNTNWVPDYYLVDAMAKWQVMENIAVQLNVFNVFDEKYFDRIHTGGAHVVPGAGRSAVLSVGFEY